MLWPVFPTHAGNRLIRGCTKEIFFQLHRRINVDRPWDMATVIFVIKSAVDDSV